MKYHLSQEQIELMSEPELFSKFDQVFNELASRKQDLEECHCMLSHIQNALQRFKPTI